MTRRTTGFASLTMIAIAGLVGLATPGLAQTVLEAERVRFDSPDGVALRGDYFAGRGRSSPAVLLIHGVGKEKSSEAWRPLASVLAKKGYAVLAFDFRGHGDSTEVDPDVYWSVAYNRSLVRGVGSNNIAFKDFDSRYYPVLANDIAAARAFLDRRNDLGSCNSSNLIVIGTREGATLGALWINSEYQRHQVLPAQFFGQPPQISKSPEGKKMLCALWLNIQPRLGNRRVSLTNMLYTPAVTGKLPNVFLYGAKDAAAKSVATQCEKALVRSAKLPFTGKAEVPAAADVGATWEEHPAIEQIVTYLERVQEEFGNEWVEFEFRESQYVWRTSRGFIDANKIGNLTPNFDTYERFLSLR